MEYYNVKFVSDLDYSYNEKTGQFDIPAVEWESLDGRWWEHFESEEARSKALQENEAYNNLPEVRAFIDHVDHEDDLWRAKMDVDDILSYFIGEVVEYAHVLKCLMIGGNKPHVQKFVAQEVVNHNKPLIKARHFKVATQSIGDFMK